MERVSRLWRENRITLVAVAVLILAYLALRSSPSEIGSTQAFLESLSSGEPTVAYFYSNY